MKLLKFSDANKQAKLGQIKEFIPNANIHSLSLPSGYTCPFADECLSKADRNTGKITDGKNTKFRCFSTSTESVFPTVRNQRWHNFDLLRKIKNVNDMAKLINDSLPTKANIIRIHVGGDFFNAKYFNAWLKVASMNKNIIFYAYTKSIKFWIDSLNGDGLRIPTNLILNASRGGTQDHLIDEYNLKCAEVVYSVEQAEELGLEIDHDESHAIIGTKSFALLIHGTQPKGTDAAQAKKNLEAKNIKHSYSRVKATA